MPGVTNITNHYFIKYANQLLSVAAAAGLTSTTMIQASTSVEDLLTRMKNQITTGAVHLIHQQLLNDLTQTLRSLKGMTLSAGGTVIADGDVGGAQTVGDLENLMSVREPT